jgi:hypothetical protein
VPSHREVGAVFGRPLSSRGSPSRNREVNCWPAGGNRCGRDRFALPPGGSHRHALGVCQSGFALPPGGHAEKTVGVPAPGLPPPEQGTTQSKTESAHRVKRRMAESATRGHDPFGKGSTMLADGELQALAHAASEPEGVTPEARAGAIRHLGGLVIQSKDGDREEALWRLMASSASCFAALASRTSSPSTTMSKSGGPDHGRHL